MKKKKAIKVRKSWGPICPATKIKPNGKLYKRKNLSPDEIRKYYGVE
jgi:hypothetical protein